MYFERRLTDEHRSLIAKTPFAWFLDVNVNVKLGLGLSTDGENINLKEEMGNIECVKYIGLVVDDVYVGASTKDKKEYRPTPTRKDAQPRPNKIQKRNRRENFMRALEDQEFLIEELKRRVAGLEAELGEEKARRQNKDHGGQSVPRTEPSLNTGFVSPNDIDRNQQPLKTYVRLGSRRRYKGRALRTPYTGTVVLRKKKE
ncbi:hypothetical protein LR48_Vigan09g135300 [Vigna angularis]|uniref:Uncharacterized protein n=1 Tax=Phaseolus angularis TaxID=3914 RepID=A0A0L9VDE4_PHAAN|nr:hypothetical protein LR48_Vigan09g135300 [Vigna angularis]